MRRRAFLQASGSAVITWPMRAWAQKDTKLPLVAVLFPGTEELFKPRVAAVRDGLKDEGLVEGRDYVLEIRVASGDFSLLPRLAQELDALLPKVFVAAATAAGVVHNVLPDRQLVFTAMAVDPVAVGLAESYRRPGGTATGNVMNAVGGEESLTAKRLGLLQGPGPEHRATWYDWSGLGPSSPRGRAFDVRRKRPCKKSPFSLASVLRIMRSRHLMISNGSLPRRCLMALDALYISGDPLLTVNMSRVMPHILATRKPTLGVYPEWGRAGLLLTYSTDALDGYRRAGVYAAKIVRGAKPGDLPIEQASKFWLVVNLKTAKQLGIKRLLQFADGGRRGDRIIAAKPAMTMWRRWLRQNNTTGKSPKTCPSLRAKIFRFPRRANQRYQLAPSHPMRGAARDRHERAVGCGGRESYD